MDLQVVVLAGGASKNIVLLVSKEVPKPLLPVGCLVCYGAIRTHWSKVKMQTFVLGAGFQVAAVPEDVGTAGALKAIALHLTANDFLVVNVDLVSHVPSGVVAAAHRRHDAVVTVMLCSALLLVVLQNPGPPMEKIKPRNQDAKTL